MIHTTPVSIIDIMPTMLDILEIEPPGQMEGVSLLPMLRGKEMNRGPIISQRRSFGKPPKNYLRGSEYSIIDGKWHLITSSVRDYELYNLYDDKAESFHIRSNKARMEELEIRLNRKLRKLKPLFGPPTSNMDREIINQLRSLGYVQ